MAKKIFLIFIISLLIFLLTGYFLFQISKSRTFQFFGELINRVDTKEKIVALTFDDAPTEHTEEVLKILKDKNVKGTFYIIGSEAEKYSDLAKKIAENGHELGNHSYSHARFLLKSQSFIKEEIEKSNLIIRDSGYGGEITFRPPNGKKLFGLPWYLSKHSTKTIMWDVEPDTYFQGDTDKIISYTLENTKPGSIILLHPLCGNLCHSDREALPKIIDGLKDKGFEFVTIVDLLSYK